MLSGALAGRPFLVVGIVFGNDQHRHVAVLDAAELRALPAVDARALGANGEFVEPSRDQVLLAGEARYPERMNDIGAFKLETNVLADRDVNFICGLEAARWIGIDVLNAPPPLMAP